MYASTVIIHSVSDLQDLNLKQKYSQRRVKTVQQRTPIKRQVNAYVLRREVTSESPIVNICNYDYCFFVVQYIVYIYRFIKEWLKSPKWSFSCCLALLLPLNDLQGEVRGFAGRNVFKNQLQTGKMNMPSISSSFQDTGAINFSLEKDQPDLTDERNSDHEEIPGNKSKKQTKTRVNGKESIFTKISVHKVRKMAYDTSF